MTIIVETWRNIYNSWQLININKHTGSQNNQWMMLFKPMLLTEFFVQYIIIQKSDTMCIFCIFMHCNFVGRNGL